LVNISAYDDKHYTPAELAALWGVHPKTIRRLFRNEPGVLVAAAGRERVTIRIPASVAVRVHNRRQIRTA
jgi:hypothetical protein